MEKFREIHGRALQVAGRYQLAEADLVSILQEVEAERVFLRFECTSLFMYGVRVLGLSEDVVGNAITVARKAREVPALQAAVLAGELSISKARKIAPVLTKNPEEWVQKAKTLSCRNLEKEVAAVLPAQPVSERIKFVGADRVELRVGISTSLEEKLKQAQDLESQRRGRAATLEETLEALTHVYLEVKDPVKRAERVLKRRPNQSKRTSRDMSARIRHEVHARDQGQCTHINSAGRRCENRRWIDIHHVVPREVGGAHTADTLVTLCSAHHRMEHA